MYNPTFHNRQSTRLKGYDYGSIGWYFVTICTYDNISYFGKIIDGQMLLNSSGEIAKECWIKIPEHFPHTRLHEFVIMPDHIHGIIEITQSVELVDLVGSKNFSPLPNQPTEFKSPSRTIGSIVRGFKIGVTKWMRQNTDIKNIWHRNYHDRIIRDRKRLHKVKNYILNNPKN